jgi:hypothetical protein
MTKLTITRTLGALALLAVGGVHYQQYHYAFYSSIPTIGPLFLVNFVAATVLGLFLLPPFRPLRRLGHLPDLLAALGGIGVSAGAFVALLISEQTPLFGFREQGYRFAIVFALASEALAVILLALFLWSGRGSLRRQPGGAGREQSGPSNRRGAVAPTTTP